MPRPNHRSGSRVSTHITVSANHTIHTAAVPRAAIPSAPPAWLTPRTRLASRLPIQPPAPTIPAPAKLNALARTSTASSRAWRVYRIAHINPTPVTTSSSHRVPVIAPALLRSPPRRRHRPGPPSGPVLHPPGTPP